MLVGGAQVDAAGDCFDRASARAGWFPRAGALEPPDFEQEDAEIAEVRSVPHFGNYLDATPIF